MSSFWKRGRGYVVFVCWNGLPPPRHPPLPTANGTNTQKNKKTISAKRITSASTGPMRTIFSPKFLAPRKSEAAFFWGMGWRSQSGGNAWVITAFGLSHNHANFLEVKLATASGLEYKQLKIYYNPKSIWSDGCMCVICVRFATASARHAKFTCDPSCGDSWQEPGDKRQAPGDRVYWGWAGLRVDRGYRGRTGRRVDRGYWGRAGRRPARTNKTKISTASQANPQWLWLNVKVSTFAPYLYGSISIVCVYNWVHGRHRLAGTEPLLTNSFHDRP